MVNIRVWTEMDEELVVSCDIPAQSEWPEGVPDVTQWIRSLLIYSDEFCPVVSIGADNVAAPAGTYQRMNVVQRFRVEA